MLKYGPARLNLIHDKDVLAVTEEPEEDEEETEEELVDGWDRIILE